MRLSNDRYEEIKSVIVATYEKFNIHTLPINCFELAHKLGIKTIPFSFLDNEQLDKISFCEGEAIMFCLNDKSYIFYNDIDNSTTRQRFSIFHELGHYILGHKCESELAKSEADFFARYAIAPIPLVWKTNCKGIVDIQNRFNTSFECASNIKDNFDNWLNIKSENIKDFEKRVINLFEQK